jgi:hypothetical protein
MTHLLNPQTALRLTYLIERLMFPLDGYPAPSPIEPMPDEARDLRMRMNTRVGEVLPGELAKCPGFLLLRTEWRSAAYPRISRRASLLLLFSRGEMTRKSRVGVQVCVGAPKPGLTPFPAPFRAVFCPQARDVRRILDPLDDPGCNAHLVAMLLDAIVGTLEPELVVSVSVGVSGRDEPPRDKGDMKVEQKE